MGNPRKDQDRLRPSEIRKIRIALGVTPELLGITMGLGEATIGNWEAGIEAPTLAQTNFLRMLFVFPHAWEFLKSQSWKSL